MLLAKHHVYLCTFMSDLSIILSLLYTCVPVIYNDVIQSTISVNLCFYLAIFSLKLGLLGKVCIQILLLESWCCHKI